MDAKDKIEREMTLAAPRDKVWDAITKPALLKKWFASNMDAQMLEVGQEFQFDWRPEHGYARAIVAELEPKTRFAYHWENEGSDQAAPIATVAKTLVTFILEDAPEGTRLTLVESGFASLPNAAKAFGENSSGWDTELAELKAFLEREVA